MPETRLLLCVLASPGVKVSSIDNVSHVIAGEDVDINYSSIDRTVVS